MFFCFEEQKIVFKNNFQIGPYYHDSCLNNNNNNNNNNNKNNNQLIEIVKGNGNDMQSRFGK